MPKRLQDAREDRTMTLMAKSIDHRFDETALTLAGHSLRVEEAARALHASLAADLERTFGLDAAERARLERLSTLAALLHDIGKATSSFQATVAGVSKERHPWRHEFLSAAMVHSEIHLGRWLATVDDEDRALVSMMIAGHHLRARNDMANARVARAEDLLLGADELRPVWQRAAEILNLAGRPCIANTSAAVDEVSDLVSDYIIAASRCDRGRDRSSPILPLGKAMVIAADIVGSAHAGDTPISDWVREVLASSLTEEALRGVVDARLGGASPRSFQEQVGNSTERVTLVTAGCGNGKTLAAYLWACRHAVGRRLAFCYPTTGTTTAGFADYLLAQTDLERRLLHSRARVDVEAFERSPDDDVPLEVWAPDVLDRWSAQVVACTADTALGLMTNWRTALASLPLWAKCAFVFDEVHSYDGQLFGTLLDFLRVVRAPVLLMTASLSAARHAALQHVLGHALVPIRGETAIEEAQRYELRDTVFEAALEHAARAFRDREKVLWVANTVRRAQAVYRALRAVIGPDAPRLYHSRFRYCDRVERQAEVIQSFRSDRGGIVVATQVCEMSLDISADLLITELAPFPSVVQRLGRLNRRAAVPESPRPCLWYQPEDACPYSSAELRSASDTIRKLPARALSQSDLAAALASIEEAPYEVRATPFSTQTWMTFPVPLRDSTPSWTIVRRTDLPGDLSRARRIDVVRNEIAMPPRRGAAPAWPILHGAFVVPDEVLRYTREEGASWAS